MQGCRGHHNTGVLVMQPPPRIQGRSSSFISTRKSKTWHFFSSRLNLALTLLVVALLIVLAFILGFVTVPDFALQSASTHSFNYAVVPQNFPDPSFIKNNGVFYAFGTRNSKVNVQVAIGNNISTWALKQNHDALPEPGAWTATQLNDTQVWAPSVTATLSGEYLMFYSALHINHTRKHCIGAATSRTIVGPYTALPDPMVCDFPHGGVIDPAYFHDPGTNISYLIYKQDGNVIGAGGACSNGNWPNAPTPLMALQLSAIDLVTPVGSPFELLTNIRADGPNIESPMLYYYEYINGSKFTRSYHLLYNSGCYHDSSYKIEHIVCVPSSETTYSTSGIRGCYWEAYRSQAANCKSNCTTYRAGTLLNSDADVDVGTVDLARLGSYNTSDGLTVSKTKLKLMAPGGPAIGTSTQGGIGDGNDNKQYLAFHADTNLNWFKDPQTQQRVRSMFIAELEYNVISMDVRVKGLVKPGT